MSDYEQTLIDLIQEAQENHDRYEAMADMAVDEDSKRDITDLTIYYAGQLSGLRQAQRWYK